MTQAAKMTQLAIAALEDKKAEDITLIDIAKVSVRKLDLDGLRRSRRTCV